MIPNGRTRIVVRPEFFPHHSMHLLKVILDSYSLHCTVTADLSHIPLRPRAKAFGYRIFYRLEYAIVLLFGLTKLQACIAWEENVRPNLITCKGCVR